MVGLNNHGTKNNPQPRLYKPIKCGAESNILTPADALTTIAEIAVTLAGFTGIIIVLRQNASTDEQVVRVLNILIICFMIIFGALTPFALSAFQLPDHIVWGAPCVLVGSFLLAFDLWGIHSYRKGSLDPSFPKIMFANMIVAGLLAIALLAAGLGIWINASPALLLAALIYLIVFAGHAFTASLVWVFKSEAR